MKQLLKSVRIYDGTGADPYEADILPEGIPDREQPFGIEKVFINGQPVYSENRLDEQALTTSGRAVPVFG